MPRSTMVPIAIPMPESATMLASTPNRRMQTNVKSTEKGSRLDTRSEPRRCRTITSTTTTVTRIC